MEEMKKYFSENDILEVKQIAKITLETIDVTEISRQEYVNLRELLEISALKDLYNRRYKNS